MERMHVVGRSDDGRRLLLAVRPGEPASLEIEITDALRRLILHAGSADEDDPGTSPDAGAVDRPHVRVLPRAAAAGPAGLTGAAMRRAGAAPPRVPELQGVRALIRDTGSGQAAALAPPMHTEADPETSDAPGEPAADPAGDDVQPVTRLAGVRAVRSRLTPGEIQALLRAGRSIPSVARAAGAPLDWVRRLDQPIQNERRLVVTGMLHARVIRPRLGTAEGTIGEAIGVHLRRRGVPESVLSTGWSASRPASGPWRVRLSFESRGRPRKAEWEYTPAQQVAHPLDPLAAELGWPPAERPPRS